MYETFHTSLQKRQLSSKLLRAKNKTTEISASMKLAELSRLVQYRSLASLLLLSADICPNTGWAYSVLNSPGHKIAHLNIRSLPKHLNEFKILKDQLIKKPTHISKHSSTTIDLAFTNDPEKIIKSGVLQCSISDHSLIFLTRRAKKLRNPGKKYSIPKL